MMFRNVFPLAALTTTLLATGTAAAQNPGESMDVVFGIDRAFGLYFSETEIDTPVGESDADFTAFGLGWSSNADPLPVHSTRFGFDIFVIDRLSVGGNVGFVVLDGDAGDRSGFIFSPRVGYFLDISRSFGFWPRGGFTFYTLDDPDQHQFLFNVEGLFTFSPAGQWAFTFGPAIDLGVGGEFIDIDYTERSFGIVFGMIGWL